MKCKECNTEIKIAMLFDIAVNQKNKMLFYCPLGCVSKEVYMDPFLIEEIENAIEKKSPA